MSNSALMFLTRDDIWEAIRESLRSYCILTKNGVHIDQAAASAIDIGLAAASDAHQRRLIPAGEVTR